MYHSAIELQAIVDAHQEDLRTERYPSASTRATPRLISSLRRYLGLALISAGETIADRRPARLNANLEPVPASSASRLGS